MGRVHGKGQDHASGQRHLHSPLQLAVHGVRHQVQAQGRVAQAARWSKGSTEGGLQVAQGCQLSELRVSVRTVGEGTACKAHASAQVQARRAEGRRCLMLPDAASIKGVHRLGGNDVALAVRQLCSWDSLHWAEAKDRGLSGSGRKDAHTCIMF